MGIEIDREEFEPEEFARFSVRLGESLRALERLLARPGFGVGSTTLGAELELSLVDPHGDPLLLNHEVLSQSVDPRLTVELDRFNLECNLDYGPLAGRAFAALEREFENVLDEVTRAAAELEARPAMVGILPTLREHHLGRDAMSDAIRYRALSRRIRELRNAPFHLRIDGDDPLDHRAKDLTFEGAATSLQLHLRVDPERFSELYNAVQLATAPVLAVSGNSPTFLGHRLWEETRIALFKQSVDLRDHERGAGATEARVGFGTGWVTNGALELFHENVAAHEPLLPVLTDEDPLATLEDGRVPRLEELRLHQGTIWSWNRVIYDSADRGHLRIEMRALPSGPTVADMLANAAFLIGLTYAFAEEIESRTSELPFADAHWNFYRAAQSGLDAELRWPGAGSRTVLRPVKDLVDELLPLARAGLRIAGLDPTDADARLDVVAERTASAQTGARWQKLALEEAGRSRSRADAERYMIMRYLERSTAGRPVHTWLVRDGSV